MPDKSTIKKAKKDKREGKSPSTQASEFVHDEIDKIRQGEHGARNTKQAIAIGLSEARRAGVKIPRNPNKKSKTSKRASSTHTGSSESSAKRSRATLNALKREPRSTVSSKALSRQTHAAAKSRGASARKAAARKAAHTREMRAHH
jgi:hypothetical protein